MPDMKAAALGYARQGWPVFPLTPRAKVPLDGTNGVLDATTDAATIERWWAAHPKANIGFHPAGADMMVVDLDPGHDRAQLTANLGGLPKTNLVQFTPRGGEHLFYALADGEIVAPSASKLAPHVDVRSFHSYVALAPSVTDAGSYEWENGYTVKPAYRTDEMVRLSNIAKTKSAQRDEWIIEPDLAENVTAAIRWLERDAKIAVQGRGGDHVAYATAAMMKSFGIAEETATELLWEHWNPRCIPPWSGEEFEHLEAKVTHAYEYNTSAPGNMTEAYREAKRKVMFTPVARKLVTPDERQGNEVAVGRFRIVDRAGMAAIAPPTWLIQDVLPEQAHAILVGQPGVFKSFLALDMALSIACPPRFPRPEGSLWPLVPGHGKVLYIAGEGRAAITPRVRAWEQRHNGGVEVEGFYLADPVPNAGRDEDIENFLDAAFEFSDQYTLIVVDTIGRALQGLNENSQQDASRLTYVFTRFREEFGAATLGVAHEGKGDSGQTRGSSVFEADADVVLRAVRREKEKFVAIYNPKQKDAQEIEGATWAAVEEMKIDASTKSLAIVKAKREEIKEEVAAKARKDERAAKTGAAVILVLDKAIERVLSTNKIKEWSTREISEALAMRPEIELSSKTLQNSALVDIRETSGTVANRSYDPAKKKWRFTSA